MAARAGHAPLRRRTSGIDRAFQVLDHLTQCGAPATAYDIARAIGAPTSTVYDVIDTLLAKGALVRGDDDGRVFLGPRLHFYGLAYARELSLSGVLADAIRALSRETGETVQVCVRDGDMMVVQMMAAGTRVFRIGSDIGTRVPLNWTASGRLLLAPLGEAERAALLARARPSPTGRAETDPRRLGEAAEAAWRTRLAIQVSEADEDVACIAAPVRDAAGACPATISIVVPGTRADERVDALAEAVRRAASEVELAMGWHHPVFASPRALARDQAA
ncbi:IclR family transcriptional regulator [Elioraea sp.]|uniref:IclR family transcriptional regulator n=1 Tax=Elioraea sp. TaxID=2185103 RepID=UPI0025BCDB62|nr:IclR family transcriptional regulator [Elioraea sp.]